MKSVELFDPTKDYSETDTADEDEFTSLPEPLTSLFDPSMANQSSKTVYNRCEKLYSQYKQSLYDYQLNNLIDITNDQSMSRKWFYIELEESPHLYQN